MLSIVAFEVLGHEGETDRPGCASRRPPIAPSHPAAKYQSGIIEQRMFANKKRKGVPPACASGEGAGESLTTGDDDPLEPDLNNAGENRMEGTVLGYPF